MPSYIKVKDLILFLFMVIIILILSYIIVGYANKNQIIDLTNRVVCLELEVKKNNYYSENKRVLKEKVKTLLEKIEFITYRDSIKKEMVKIKEILKKGL